MVLYVGSENEIRQIKIFKWVFDGTTFDLTKHAIAYDEILAVTHPQHRTLGVDRLTVVADHEQENTAEPELVAGPTVLGSAEQLPLLEAQKMLTEVLAKLGQVFDEPPAVGRKSLVRWTKVLSLYNEALE